MSPYIPKPKPLHIYYFDEDLEKLQLTDPGQIASNLLPEFAHFPVIARKTRLW